MCVAVRDSCAPVLLCHGHPWPTSLDCDRFPGDEDMCLAPLTKEYKYMHKGTRGWWRGGWPYPPGYGRILGIKEIQGHYSQTFCDFVNAVKSSFTASRVPAGGWQSASAGSASCTDLQYR